MMQLIPRFLRNRDGRIPVHTRWYVVDSSPIVGKTIADLNIHNLTGSTVLAVRRAGVSVQYPDHDFPLLENDELYLAGTEAQLAFVERAYGLSVLDAPRADDSCPMKNIA